MFSEGDSVCLGFSSWDYFSISSTFGNFSPSGLRCELDSVYGSERIRLSNASEKAVAYPIMTALFLGACVDSVFVC